MAQGYVNGTAPVLPDKIVQGRLTLLTGNPIPTGDVTAATTLYFTPFRGNQIDLYTGTTWQRLTFSQVSIAIPASTSQMYDVWGIISSGSLALELLAWTNDTTRATALTTQDGVYVKSGDATRRYLGSFRTTGVSGQSEDSILNRLCWNYYNRFQRKVKATDSTTSWTYTTAAWRQANGNTANQVNYVSGVAENINDIKVQAGFSNSSASINASVSIGVSSTTVNSADVYGFTTAGAGGGGLTHANVLHTPAVGYVSYVWLEQSAASGTTTWYGTNGVATQLGGLTGMIWS